jgi:hypothetical protein
MIKFIFILLCLTHCATLVKDPNRPYFFFSKQIDTSFYVDGNKVSESYLELPLPKIPDQKVKVRAEKSGYKPEEIELRYVFNSDVHLNFFLLILYPVGVLVDYLSGSFYSYRADQDTFYLVKDKNFVENSNANSYKLFEEERETLQPGDGYLSVNLSSKIVSISKLENGNFVDSDKRIGFLKPGKYLVKAYFSHTIRDNNNFITYEAKSNETVDFEIKSNSLTVICTDFDLRNSKNTIFQVIYSKPNPRLAIIREGLLQQSGNLFCPPVMSNK